MDELRNEMLPLGQDDYPISDPWIPGTSSGDVYSKMVVESMEGRGNNTWLPMWFDTPARRRADGPRGFGERAGGFGGGRAAAASAERCFDIWWIVPPDQWDKPAPWIPGTASDDVYNKMAIEAMEGRGNNTELLKWFDMPRFSRRAAGRRGFGERAGGLGGGGLAAAAPESYVCDASVALSAQSTVESTQKWRQIRYTDRTALTNSATDSCSAAAAPPMLINGSPSHGGERSSSRLPLNGKVALSSDLLSDAQSRLVTRGTVVPSFAHITPEKHKVAQDGGHPGNVGSVNGGRTVGQGLDMVSFPPTFVPKEKSPIQLCFDKGGSGGADLMSVVLPSQLQENKTIEEAEKQGIDLNKTPQQKPWRKKHRPKVVQEGTVSRTPKSSTPKAATLKPAMTGESVSTKRKYVQRKGVNSPLETPSGALGEENVELSKTKKASYTKRHLDFSVGDGNATDTFQCNNNAGSQEQLEPLHGNKTHFSSENGSGDDKSTDMFMKRQVVAANLSAGISPLLNPSNDKILEAYLNSLDIPSLHLQPSRRELMWENLKKLARIRDGQEVQGHGGNTLSERQTDSHLIPKGLPFAANR